MIAAQRSTNLSSGTDAVSASLRPTLSAPAIRIAPAKRPSFAVRPVRAVAFRLSVFGGLAAMVAILHG